MLNLRVRNVCHAWPLAVKLIKEQGRLQPSRAGDVLVLDEPVMTEYLRPVERVLFCPIRNANPFFHLMEALWMLAGRNDARWLDQFVVNFSSRFAEADGTQWGAYGKRWRSWFSIDQLDVIINRLRKDKLDRRVVLAMWDPDNDLIDIDEPFNPKDLPCNTQVYFRIVQDALDMTVMCRSNDIVWGCYGANAVHFSILQEYMAAMIGCGVGSYRQFSNNWHAYIATLPSVEPQLNDNYLNIHPSVLVHKPDLFDRELHQFISDPMSYRRYDNPFLEVTAAPMYRAARLVRDKKYDDALKVIDLIQALDWKMAAREYVLRRMG
jgi:thymidylate synthase